LVVSTILKNISSSMGRIIPYIMENKKCLKPLSRLWFSLSNLLSPWFFLSNFLPPWFSWSNFLLWRCRLHFQTNPSINYKAEQSNGQVENLKSFPTPRLSNLICTCFRHLNLWTRHGHSVSICLTIKHSRTLWSILLFTKRSFPILDTIKTALFG
jgi:hypothetical protein